MSAAVFTDSFLFTDKFLRRFLTGVILSMVVVVIAVAAAAFFTSFEAIRDFAEKSGGIKPEHAWLAPLLVDSFIFIASAADLWLTITGSNRHTDTFMQNILVWSPKALLAAAAAGSFALNIAHAPDHIGAQAIAALPPVALVLTFEILMMVVRRAAAARVERLTELPRARSLPTVLAEPGGSTAAVATEAGSTPVPPRPRPVAERSGTLDKKHEVALRRAFQTGGPTKVEQVRAARNLPRSVVPERWQLPSQNGTRQEVGS